MTALFFLIDMARPPKKSKRVGRGPGSKLGKTCGRGQKGMGARCGSKRRLGYEGGQFRTYMKMPIRGFTRGRFLEEYSVVNLAEIDECFAEGELVDRDSLFDRGLIGKRRLKIKVLGEGTLTKKLDIVVDEVSHSAREKLEKAGCTLRH